MDQKLTALIALYNKAATFSDSGYWRALVTRGTDTEPVLTDYYRVLGYCVQRTRTTEEGRFDLKISRGGRSTVVDPKAYATPVGVDALARIFYARIREGADEAALIGLSGFTKQCQDEAVQPTSLVRLTTADELVRGAQTRANEILADIRQLCLTDATIDAARVEEARKQLSDQAKTSEEIALRFAWGFYILAVLASAVLGIAAFKHLVTSEVARKTADYEASFQATVAQLQSDLEGARNQLADSQDEVRRLETAKPSDTSSSEAAAGRPATTSVLRKVRLGMSKEDVLRLLGSPSSATAISFTYWFGDYSCEISFDMYDRVNGYSPECSSPVESKKQ